MSAYARDVLERAGIAFLEGALGGVAITQASNISMWWAALSAGVSPALSVLKSAAAARVGNPGSASLSRKI